jgi:flagellar hook-associated protein 1 FlgK
VELGSIFGILQVSQRAMAASQLGVQIANHNIANINTPGYSRQEVELTSKSYLSGSFGDIGGGVEVERIRRMNNQFLDRVMHNEQSDYNEWQSAASILQEIESVVGMDETSSLGAAITDFFNAFGDLAEAAEDSAARTVVVNRGITLTDQFHSINQSLQQTQTETNERISNGIELTNDILRQLAELNEMITHRDIYQSSANDLRVQRDQLLSQLSQYVSYTASEDDFGALDVYIAGKNVIHRDGYTALKETRQNSEYGYDLAVEISNEVILPDRLGGSLGAWADTRDNELASVRKALDSLAEMISTKVNDLHVVGYSPSGPGVPFFSGTTSRDIEVNVLIREDPNHVAASYSQAAGDNTLALDLFKLADESVDELGGKSFIEYFAELVGNVGSLSQSAQEMTDNKELALQQVESLRDGVAGVSLDEELANITKYQTSYEAAAVVVNTVKDMIDTLLTLGA